MRMNSIINRVILFLYIAINTLFVEKYVSRITSYHWLVAIIYVIGVCLVIWFLNKRLNLVNCSLKTFIGILIVMSAIAIGLQYTIDPFSINVDRWSAIHNFISGMLQGQYPYGQQTHLGGYGSPFPVWQILHLPFYAIGNVGLSIIFVMLLFLLTVYRVYSNKIALFASVLLCISPAFWYEVAVRSDLITNIMLSAIIVDWLVYKNVKLTNHIIGIGILMGLILSTRLIAVIPICVIYGYEFLQMPWKKQCLFGLIIIGVFSLTMLPFVFWEGSTLMFFDYNPFILQTRQGSWLVLLIFAIIAILMVVLLREKTTYRLAVTGLLLTTLVAMAFLEKMWQHTLWDELFSSTFDITYLSVALPFYITYLSQELSKKGSISS